MRENCYSCKYKKTVYIPNEQTSFTQFGCTSLFNDNFPNIMLFNYSDMPKIMPCFNYELVDINKIEDCAHCSNYVDKMNNGETMDIKGFCSMKKFKQIKRDKKAICYIPDWCPLGVKSGGIKDES